MAILIPNQDSPLFSLPAELRNEIYTQVLVGNEEIDVSSATAYTQRALLDVCKQTRKEATEIYYGENSFCLTTHDKAKERLKKWVSKADEMDRFLVGAIRLKYNLDAIECELEMLAESYQGMVMESGFLTSEGWDQCVRVEAERVAQLAAILLASEFLVLPLGKDESALARMQPLGVWDDYEKRIVFKRFFYEVKGQFNNVLSNWPDKNEEEGRDKDGGERADKSEAHARSDGSSESDE